jgi:hypothetical protein
MTDHPALPAQLVSNALLLAMTGRVIRTGPDDWQVKGQTNEAGHCHVYTVKANGCNCEAFQYKTTVIPDLGPVCKHTVACLIQSVMAGPVDPPANLYDLITRLMVGQLVPAPMQKDKPGFGIIDLPGSNVKWVRPNRADGREVLCLKLGRIVSGPMAYWHTIVGPQGNNRGQWCLVENSQEVYKLWVEKVTSKEE